MNLSASCAVFSSSLNGAYDSCFCGRKLVVSPIAIVAVPSPMDVYISAGVVACVNM